MVYNHTGEGERQRRWQDGEELISFRGLDNPGYYELSTNPIFIIDSNGVGPNLNAAHRWYVRDLTLDSLTYWKDMLGFDGFRFDLARFSGNTCERGCFNFNKFTPQNSQSRGARNLPVRPEAGGDGVRSRLLSLGRSSNGTYQLGEFPSGLGGVE